MIEGKHQTTLCKQKLDVLQARLTWVAVIFSLQAVGIQKIVKLLMQSLYFTVDL